MSKLLHRRFSSFGLRAIIFTAIVSFVTACGGGVSPSRLPEQQVDIPTARSISPATVPIPPMLSSASALSAVQMASRRPESDITALGFTQLPGAAVYAAASPDGTFWVLSTVGLPNGDKLIYHYVNGTYINVPGAASRIAVGPDNTPWVLNSAGGIYFLKNGVFTGIAGGASELSVGADGSLYVISNQPGGPYGRGIYRYTNSVWTQLPGAGVTVAASFDTGSYAIGNIAPGGFYVTNLNGSIFYYNPASGFTQLPGGAISLAPTSSGGLFALGDPGASQHGIYYNNLTTGVWVQMPGAAVSLAVSASTVIAIGAAGGIYESALIPLATPSPSPVSSSSPSPSFSPSPSASVIPSPSPSESSLAPTPIPSLSPSPIPSPTQTPTYLNASPSTISLNSLGAQATVVVTDSGYTGTISHSFGTANVVSLTGTGTYGVYTITALNAGTTTVTFSDTRGYSSSLLVTVTTVGIIVQ